MSQIKSFVTILLCGVAFAALTVYFLVNTFSPSGQYTVKHILLNPETIQHLWYSDYNSKTGGHSRFVLNDITFEHVDETTGKKIIHEINLRQYNDFFDLIQNDMSLLESENKKSLFDLSPQAIVSVSVKTESSAKWQAIKETFQQVQIAQDGNHYRIDLREDNPGENWVYFQHEGLYKKLLKVTQ